ncbi:MAG: haloacid dehalogenase-like hydrolase [Bdellovibrionales bacterium]|nr:haloacid dehalogenase-like hydrolase [Bdellovibrionales bacterium]
MMYKTFSNEMLNAILAKVDDLKKKFPPPYYAAFDADGTLWDSDVGENFFQFQIDHCDLAALKGIDPWEHYLSLKKKHPPEAYLWLAQICSGFSLAQVRLWAQKAVELRPPEVFESQKILVAELVKRNVQVYVVSASVHWAVEAALSTVGLPLTSAMGVKTKVVGGNITKTQDGPITWRAGKAEALMLATKGIPPIFCSGNSSGDVQLLQCSVGDALAIQTQSRSSQHQSLYADEQSLLTIAQEQGWWVHSFI